MKEKTSRKEFPVKFLLAVRETMNIDWGIPDDLLMTVEEIVSFKGFRGQTFSPLRSGYVIHPGTKRIIKIPKGRKCQRNFDGTAVHIDPFGEPIFFNDLDSSGEK